MGGQPVMAISPMWSQLGQRCRQQKFALLAGDQRSDHAKVWLQPRLPIDAMESAVPILEAVVAVQADDLVHGSATAGEDSDQPLEDRL
ncbi:hypothetical protein D9M73_261700 [compost metagenome]